MKLLNKVGLVTGGAGGIGRGIALEFAREGADVAIADINEEKGKATAQEVRSLGRRALFVRADVSQRPDVEAMIAACDRELGGLDILVNNAAALRGMPFLDLTDDAWDFIMAVNLKSVFMGAQAAARYWTARKRRGKVINISSVDEHMTYPYNANYCVSKAGVNMLTKASSLALAEHGINVNSIAPGIVESGMTGRVARDLEWQKAVIPFGRIGQPAEIGRVAVFLASEDADYMTGSTVYVDGGHMISPPWQLMSRYRGSGPVGPP